MDAIKQKVIVIDDSRFSIKVISEIINSDEAFSVTGEFDSAQDALDFTSQNEVNIALIDVVMPHMSGIELAKKISSVSTKTKIIMVSSLAGESIIIDSISAGAIDYIQKPFSKDVLLTSLRNAAFN